VLDGGFQAGQPTRLDQLRAGCLPASELELSAEERERLEAPAPPPAMYPQRMLREQVGIEEPPPLRRRLDRAAQPAR
jgi:hypothetical protein